MGGVPGLLVLCRVVTKGGAPVTALGWEELALTSGRSLWLGRWPSQGGTLVWGRGWDLGLRAHGTGVGIVVEWGRMGTPVGVPPPSREGHPRTLCVPSLAAWTNSMLSSITTRTGTSTG